MQLNPGGVSGVIMAAGVRSWLLKTLNIIKSSTGSD